MHCNARTAAFLAAGALILTAVYLATADSSSSSSRRDPLMMRKTLATLSGGSKDSKGALRSAMGRNNTSGLLRTTLFGASSKAGGQKLTAKDTSSKATKAEVEQLLSQIGRDLAPWKESGISLEMVEKAYCTEEIGESMRFQIVNGSFYLVGPTPNYQGRARNIQHQVMELHHKFSLPDVDFVLVTSDRCKTGEAPHRSHDGNMTRCTRLAPMFSADKFGHEEHCVMAPDHAFGGWPEAYLMSWETTSGWMRAAAEARPWRKRRPEVFWSGGDTNDQRKIMVESDQVRQSNLTDIRMMSWGDGPAAFRENFRSLAEHCDYRALLHLSGVGYSARLKYLMLCGSPVIFPHKGYWEYNEFWYHLLKDKENIVFTEPVSWENWGSPVLDAMAELHKNETRARAIGAAGQHLVAEVLHPDNVALYWAELITQYSALQTFKPSLHPDAAPLEVALLRPERPLEVWDRTCKVC